MSAVTYATAQLLRVLPRARISRAVGQLADLQWSPLLGRAVVSVYSHMYDVSLDECEGRGPWASFDAFFTRKLREGARKVGHDPRSVLSPADGRIASLSRVSKDGGFVVKGRPYSVDELVGDAGEAQRFLGGAGFVVYLSPRDYHRVHAPVSGTVRRVRSMPGDYFPVNAIGLSHVPNLFCRNRRVAIEIDADEGLGRVTVVMVVAIIVGRITVDRHRRAGRALRSPILRPTACTWRAVTRSACSTSGRPPWCSSRSVPRATGWSPRGPCATARP